MTSASEAALPYHEPSIVAILILGGFLLALNIVNHIFDRIISCGLVGQILLGIAWGTPGAKWLNRESENVMVSLGYLGLLLLVYEGGLSTSWKSLKANAALSIAVALTGISLPIGLSYVLMGLTKATSLQAFAAGAALCSTSLGTTFTVLSSSGLSHTRMGVVLISAAMMDDVVGLVMVQVISNLGGAASSVSATTIVRPVFVSLAFLIAVPIACRWVAKPLMLSIDSWRVNKTSSLVGRAMIKRETAFLTHTSILLAMVAGASYSGTSNLFAAYLAGAAISWWDSVVSDQMKTQRSRPSGKVSGHPDQPEPMIEISTLHRSQEVSTTAAQLPTQEHSPLEIAKLERPSSGANTFEQYFAKPLQRILKPFFFASIGFSVPITQMFKGKILWRGLVYSLLMFVGKLACGLWLVRIAGTTKVPGIRLLRHPRGNKAAPAPESVESAASRSPKQEPKKSAINKGDSAAPPGGTRQDHQPNQGKKIQTAPSAIPSKPISLYPACILGCAMTARGEIGFLISSLAESNGVFAQNSRNDSDTFLIVTWAILLCTIIGPLCVGLLVRRVRRLEQAGKSQHDRPAGASSRWEVLGAWGVG